MLRHLPEKRLQARYLNLSVYDNLLSILVSTQPIWMLNVWSQLLFVGTERFGMPIEFTPAVRLAGKVIFLIVRGSFLTLGLILRVAFGIVKLLADGTNAPGPDGYLTHTNRYWHWHIPPP